MEILNILYNNNFIAVYLIGAILVVILIFIVLSSMTTTPKEKDKEEAILQDPTENEKIPTIVETKEEIKDIPKINDLVEDLYQQKINEEPIQIDENQDLNSFLEEFEVPNNIIEEVTNNETEISISKKEELPENEIIEPIIENKEEKVQQEEVIKTENNSENIESMLKRLYDLRQNENNTRKNALLSEIYDLKKQVDETLKASNNNYSLNYNEVDTKALADYYLFNEDIEFPKLK